MVDQIKKKEDEVTEEIKAAFETNSLELEDKEEQQETRSSNQLRVYVLIPCHKT